jgi:ATP-dependent phosphoenolpyruvate carboxykinase
MKHFIVLSLVVAFLAWRYNTVEPFSLRQHKISLRYDAQVLHNLNYADIFEQEVAEGDMIVSSGAVAIDTGKYTGRSPKDKYFVEQEPSMHEVCNG